MPTSNTGPKQPNATANKTESINPSINPSEPLPTTTVHLTDGAGGVANALKSGKIKADEVRQWFVAYVSPRAEKKVCENLLKTNYEAYVPSRWETHLWRNGQRKKVEKMVIPGVVFVKIEASRLNEIRPFPRVLSFMMDPAKRNNPNGFRSFATIRESEMRLLKAMLGQEEYDVDFATSFSLGEYVRIAGFDTYNDLAQIVELPGDKSSYVGVRVGFLGCAFMKVPVGRIIKVQS